MAAHAQDLVQTVDTETGLLYTQSIQSQQVTVLAAHLLLIALSHLLLQRPAGC
jgi:hypothetical protein